MEYENGIGEKQRKQMVSSRQTIANFLSDGKPHQFNELKKESKLSAPTLSKRLKELIEYDLITKEIDTKSGKYPYPVFYTATIVLIGAIKLRIMIDELTNNIHEYITKEKNPLAFLGVLDFYNESILTNILLNLKKDKNLDKSDLFFQWKMFVLEPYRELSLKLIEESMKVIDDIDIEKCQKVKYEAIQRAISKTLGSLAK